MNDPLASALAHANEMALINVRLAEQLGALRHRVKALEAELRRVTAEPRPYDQSYRKPERTSDGSS